VARAHALAAAALGVALAGAADQRLGIIAAGLTLGLALAIPERWLPGGRVRLALVVGAALLAVRLALGGTANAAGSPTTPASPDLSRSRWSATVEAVVRRAGGKQTAVLALAPTRVYAQLPRYPEFVPGDSIAFEGRLEPLPADPAPEVAGWVAYLQRIGVGATVEARTAEHAGLGNGPLAWLAQARSGAGDLLGVALPEPLAGLAAGILIGLRERVDPTLVREFTASGLTHVVAISGWNIAIVGATCGALTRRLSRRRRSLAIGTVIVAYAVFAGASPSVVRAALMAGVALLARESGRRAGASRALALAIVLMLLVDPAAVVDPGFQLSACATAGLLAWASPLGEKIGRRLPRVPGMIRESLAVSLSAQLATLPLVLFDFGRLSLVSPAANLVAAPLIPFVMAAAAFALPLGGLLEAGFPPILLSVPLGLASLPLALLDSIAHAAASVPFASVELPPSVAVPAAFLAGGAVLAVARSSRRVTGGAPEPAPMRP
jgi:competence protein ComEC